jgi:hypothetical protein
MYICTRLMYFLTRDNDIEPSNISKLSSKITNLFCMADLSIEGNAYLTLRRIQLQMKHSCCGFAKCMMHQLHSGAT